METTVNIGVKTDPFRAALDRMQREACESLASQQAAWEDLHRDKSDTHDIAVYDDAPCDPARPMGRIKHFQQPPAAEIVLRRRVALIPRGALGTGEELLFAEAMDAGYPCAVFEFTLRFNTPYRQQAEAEEAIISLLDSVR